MQGGNAVQFLLSILQGGNDVEFNLSSVHGGGSCAVCGKYLEGERCANNTN